MKQDDGKKKHIRMITGLMIAATQSFSPYRRVNILDTKNKIRQTTSPIVNADRQRRGYFFPFAFDDLTLLCYAG